MTRSLENIVWRLTRECEHFLSSYQEALPRIARREMQPVLDALDEIPKANPVVEVLRYSVSIEGMRVPDGTHEALKAVIVYGPNEEGEKVFGYSMLPPAGCPTVVLVALGFVGFRQVSMEEIVELGVQPWELVEGIKKLATIMDFSVAATKATQGMAKA